MLTRIYKFLASLKLAVIVVLSIAAIAAYGTIIESQYDAATAKALVYTSWYMYATMIALVVNLVFAAVERLPWKQKHIGFVMAHTGIIILVIGSYITQKTGLDGSMVFEIGEKSRWVSLPQETELSGFSTVDGTSFEKLFTHEVQFLKNPPTPTHPFVMDLGGQNIIATEYWPYAIRKTEIEPSSLESDGPAVRFQMKNARVNVVDWVMQEGRRDGVFEFGPAKLLLTSSEFKGPADGNLVALWPSKKENRLAFAVWTASKGGFTKKGDVALGDKIETGWMGLELQILKYLPKAKRQSVYTKLEKPTPISTSAVKIKFQDREEWLGLNTMLRLFDKDKAFVLTFGNKRVDVGFNLILKKFEVGRYPGSAMAMSYQSIVEVENGPTATISMNEPLKHNGLTFYQASFQENEQGEPIASILSVNRDPGRFLKYFGAILILLGSIILFYFKKKLAKIGSADA